MPNLVQLTVVSRNGVAAGSVAQVLDIDKMTQFLVPEPISGGTTLYLYEGNFRSLTGAPVGSKATTYVVAQTIAQIAALSPLIISATVVTANARPLPSGSQVRGFHAKDICGQVLTSGGNATFNYQMGGDTELVPFVVTGAISAFVAASTAAQLLYTDASKFLGLQNAIMYSAGTWTVTRVQAGEYVNRKTIGNDTTIIGIDISDELRIAASKGLKLSSIDVVYHNTVATIDALSFLLNKIENVNHVATAITNVPLTGVFELTAQANPQVRNLTVNTPAFFNPVAGDVARYVAEFTVNNTATGTAAFDYYGINLRFTRAI